jgi:hypothetical protein
MNRTRTLGPMTLKEGRGTTAGVFGNRPAGFANARLTGALDRASERDARGDAHLVEDVAQVTLDRLLAQE